MHWLFQACVLILFVGVSNGRRNLYKGLLPPLVHKHVELPKEQWFDQKLDHSDPTNEIMWKQRFFVNATFYKPGGPLFLMIGGEGPASAEWMVTGSWVEYAKEFKAKMVQVEHRYYGKSHPTIDMTTYNLRYLTSEQALADLAYFITDFKARHDMQTSKVFAFGGSYPGTLAVWFRLKYPHIVHASISSSAPLLAKVNFKEYLEVVLKSVQAKGKPGCLKAIHDAVYQLGSIVKSQQLRKIIEKKFKLCDRFDGKNEQDVTNLYELLAENFEDVVQYNEDNRGFEGVAGTNITIATLCDVMTNEKKKLKLDRYAEVNSMMLNVHNETCLDHKYASMIHKLSQTDWTDDVAGRAWIYQTCTEFGFYQSTDSPKQPFGSTFPLSFFIKQCKDIFGKDFDFRLLLRGVRRTNMLYGGQDPKTSRVALINGSIDPWHRLGVTSQTDQELPVIFIQGTAHCANMYPPSKNDSKALKEARIKVRNHIARWLK